MECRGGVGKMDSDDGKRLGNVSSLGQQNWNSNEEGGRDAPRYDTGNNKHKKKKCRPMKRLRADFR